jgi:chromosome segregation ATPase
MRGLVTTLFERVERQDRFSEPEH